MRPFIIQLAAAVEKRDFFCRVAAQFNPAMKRVLQAVGRVIS